MISNQTRAARSFDFEITRMISDQIALHSVQLPLLITRQSFNVNVMFLVPELDTFSRRDHRQIVFFKDEFYYLNVTKNETYTVRDIFDCTFKCLSNPSCLSLNLASSKGADGKLWCELLSSTKYNNTKDYRANTSTHHFSIKVSQFSVRRVK